jgi:hypothetical protein
MQDFTVDKTILAVNAFEKVLSQANCIVKHFHADNGAFAHKRFLDEVNRKDQKITFCDVGAHHQNRIIKNENTLTACGLEELFFQLCCCVSFLVSGRK